MLTAMIHDATGDVQVQFPRDLGDPIMNGQTAKEFKQFREEQSDDVTRVRNFV